jgi:broad specificity polyphosphatase/5'/3'-nucleotidase SurE
MQDRRMPEDEVKRLRIQTATLLGGVFRCLWARTDFFQNPVTWNVNLPHTAASDCAIVQTVLGHSMYGSCFNKIGDQFRHELSLSEPDVRDQADGIVVQRGHVSMTYIDIRELGQTVVPLSHEAP